MPKVFVSVNDRVKQYKTEGFYVSDNILFCKYCNRRLEHLRKDTLEKHIRSSKHIEFKEKAQENAKAGGSGLKRQASVAECMDRATKKKIEVNNFVMDTTEMFMRANIPLEKVDNPHLRTWLGKYMLGAGDLPNVNLLRQKYVPKIKDKHDEEVKVSLKGKKIVVMCDETTDKAGRCVFIVLFRTVCCQLNQNEHLVSCSFLDQANATTCSQAIVDTLGKFEIPYENVVAIVTDAARYMTKCVGSLQTLVGEHLAHVQCWAHKLNLVGNIFQQQLIEINRAVNKVKVSFQNTRKRRHSYLTFLRNKYENGEKEVKAFPTPVLTRWNSWFKSVFYVAKYLNDIIDFLSDLEKESQSNSGFDYFKKMNLNDIQIIQAQASFVLESASSMVSALETMEGAYPLAHKIISMVEDIKRGLAVCADGIFGPETSEILKSLPEMKKAEVEQILKTCSQLANEKLSALQKNDPSGDIFKATGILFDPRNTCRNNLDDIHKFAIKVPLLQNVPSHVFLAGYGAYKDILQDEQKKDRAGNVVELLLSLKEDHEDFVKASISSLWFPHSNVDSERAFSHYSTIVTDRRRNLKPENVEAMTVLYFDNLG